MALSAPSGNISGGISGSAYGNMSGSLQDIAVDLNNRLSILNNNGISCTKEQSERYNLALRFYDLWKDSGLSGNEYTLDEAYKKCKVTFITLPTKVRIVKAMLFPVVMYGCESWTAKKAEHRRIYAFEV